MLTLLMLLLVAALPHSRLASHLLLLQLHLLVTVYCHYTAAAAAAYPAAVAGAEAAVTTA